MRDEEEIDRFAGDRCEICSAPATCIGPDGTLCDECCADDIGRAHQGRCVALDQAEEVRDLMGVS